MFLAPRDDDDDDGNDTKHLAYSLKQELTTHLI